MSLRCLLLVAIAVFITGPAEAQERRELKVHLAQANNDSPYAFVRAKFKPGEVADPWAVRFFDEKNAEVPYFVWDSVTWKVAREGRADWGNRYALINHAPGNEPSVIDARSQKLQAAKKSLPDLGTRLEAEEMAAKKAPDSVCAAMYLLRHRVAAFGKERLTLRIYAERQVKPKERSGERQFGVESGEFSLNDLSDGYTAPRKLLRNVGFEAGGTSGTHHGEAYELKTLEGIIAKAVVTTRTKGRNDGTMDWQRTYWLFPEGGFVALEGFSLSDTTGYVGGPQKLAIWETDGKFTQKHLPTWDTPWWLHQVGEQGFVATHLFYATPLTVGFGNNPFTVNAENAGKESKEPNVQADGNKLALTWSHRIDDEAIKRLMVPQPFRRPKDPLPPANKPITWQPKTDWLYRQYVVGVGEKAAAAEGSLRAILGAAAGWIDRPITEEEVAAQLVAMMPRISNRQSSEIGLLKVVPPLMNNDQAGVREALRTARDQVERTNFYINLITDWVKRGGRPSAGGKVDPDGTRREGWTGNACYHAGLMPCYIRVLEYFDVPFRQKEYRDAVIRFADFTIDILQCEPGDATPPKGEIDWDKLNKVFQSEWPSRIVPVIPITLHAYTLKKDEKYAKAAKLLFDGLMKLVERNPHGYWPTWTWTPKADKFDTVYNPVGYERGITAFWSDGQLDLIGREKAARFVAAQARWFVFSGQLLDTLEIDNATAIRACAHGGHTGNRNQIGLYLWDDFNFYRGLLGELVAWSAADAQVPGQLDAWAVGAYRSLELSNAGSSMLRWAFAITPESKWLESKVQKRPNGFRLQAWNRKPLAKPTVKVAAQDAGLKGDAEVMQAQLDGAAFRLPAEIAVTWKEDSISLKVSQAAKVRLAYRLVRPDWPAKEKLLLQRRGPGDKTETLRDGVVWENDTVEWHAEPGEYELLKVEK
jgi:hypothetical protein